jgi:hypothetical protein
MMEVAKGFVGESQAFQDIKKPDGFDRIHLLLGRLTVGEKLKKRRSSDANKHLILLALPRGIEPLFQP